MPDELRIPADVNNKEMAAECGAKAVVSIRDMLLLLGASDQDLRDFDEREEILEREPWRKDGLNWVELCKLNDGTAIGYMTGKVDWSGTRFETPGGEE